MVAVKDSYVLVIIVRRMHLLGTRLRNIYHFLIFNSSRSYFKIF